jgi:hypothetical protein
MLQRAHLFHQPFDRVMRLLITTDPAASAHHSPGRYHFSGVSGRFDVIDKTNQFCRVKWPRNFGILSSKLMVSHV